jgi:hypothetical protein
MPKQYSQEAIDLCRSLYCKYGGKNFDAIEREMQKVYPGWHRNNLVDKSGKRPTLGWITKYGFDNSLKLHLQKLTESVNDDEQDLYLGIRTVRKELQKAVISGVATKDELYQYRDFCKLEIEARKNLDLSRDNLETFVSGYEKLLIWLGEIDQAAAKLLVKHGEKLAEMAQAHYGKAETDDTRASDREDEGGDKPFSMLA